MLELHGFPFEAMGTVCNLYFYAEDEARAQTAADQAIAEVARIETKYSRYDPESFLSHINSVAQIGGELEVDDETASLLNFAHYCNAQSDGLFDITCGILRRAWGDFSEEHLPEKGAIEKLLPLVGMEKIRWSTPRLAFPVPGVELDFGGLGKEYGSDKAADVLADNGIMHGLVDLGGDMNVLGPHPNGEPWQIGIIHPREPGQLLGNVAIHKGALASSGDYERCVIIDGERYSHILNPKTGRPSKGLASASVMAQRCILAGSMTTIALLKGLDGPRWLAERNEKHLCYDVDGNQGGNIVLSPA
ncbi:MAG: FAD:protein FMN transferase [Nitrospinae bacterium]|nr:FAD:protein FMN transferase [Nitrospinota bacterium]